MRPLFRPRLQLLDDRITPALSFAPQQAFDAGAAPSAVAVGDFNLDGRLDVVTANGTNNTVTLFTNNAPVGTPVSFGVSAFYTGGMNAVAVAVADFNGDGRPDLAVANADSNTVSVLLNRSVIGFVLPLFDFAPPAFAAGDNPAKLEVADFNGDGRPDIAVSAESISVLVNTTPAGATTPAFAANQFVSGGARGSMTVGDYNSDGLPDVAYTTSQYVRGLNQYYTIVEVKSNRTPVGAASLAFGGPVRAYTSNLSSFIATIRLSTVDINGYGQPSLLFNGGQSIAQNSTTPVAFNPQLGVGQSFSFGSVNPGVAADLDGDGRVDLAVPSGGGSVSTMTNISSAFSFTLTFQSEPASAVGSNPVAMASGDFDGDGRIDLVTANAGDATISVLVNTTPTAGITTPSVIGQFGESGVWRMNSSTGGWDQLTEANADVLATSPNGWAVGNFGANGVWYYNPVTGWYQINGNQATALAMDGLGNVFASFPGFGTAVYRLVGGWSSPLTSVAADLLAVSGSGEVVASFSGYGVYRWTSADDWSLITENRAATTLDIGDNGDVVASFAGFGVYRHRRSVGWDQLNGYDATVLVVGDNGDVVATFDGFGTARYHRAENGWQMLGSPGLTGPPDSLAVDLYGNVFASFTGFGVYEYTRFGGWRLRTASSATILEIG